MLRPVAAVGEAWTPEDEIAANQTRNLHTKLAWPASLPSDLSEGEGHTAAKRGGARRRGGEHRASDVVEAAPVVELLAGG